MSSTLNMSILSILPKVVPMGDAGVQVAKPCSRDAELQQIVSDLALRVAAVEALVAKSSTSSPASTTPSTPAA